MKKLLFVFIILCLLGYSGYSQKGNLTSDTLEWTEEQIITILEKGGISFCKLDLFLEGNDTISYIKDMEILLEDSIFGAAYLESSVFHGIDGDKFANCTYFIMEDWFGSQLELTKDDLVYLPKLSKYLDRKVKETKLKEYKGEFISRF